MSEPPPPFDRAIALACTMNTLRGRWLHVRCGCGAAEVKPVRLMLRGDAAMGARTVADVVVHLRCERCGARPAAVHLAENGHGPPPIKAHLKPGWCLLLHGKAAPTTGGAMR